MLLIPNASCTVTKIAETRDVFGQVTLSSTSTSARCGIVKLMTERDKTSVRADSSASRGRAQEIMADARLLFPPTVGVGIGDKITIMGIDLKVVTVFPRVDIVGRHDHNQVDADKWA